MAQCTKMDGHCINADILTREYISVLLLKSSLMITHDEKVMMSLRVINKTLKKISTR